MVSCGAYEKEIPNSRRRGNDAWFGSPHFCLGRCKRFIARRLRIASSRKALKTHVHHAAKKRAAPS